MNTRLRIESQRIYKIINFTQVAFTYGSMTIFDSYQSKLSISKYKMMPNL